MTNRVLKRIDAAKSYNAIFKIINEEFPNIRKSRGSARIVIPISKTLVLKVAKNDKGVSQNEVEHQVYRDIDYRFKKYFARVTRASDQYRWIVQAKVSNAKRHWNRTYFEVVNVHQDFKSTCLFEFDLNSIDLTQWGHINGRQVLFDYGLTNYNWKQYYKK